MTPAGPRKVAASSAALAGLSLVLAACSSGADPADYPDDDIDVIVPFSAGGPTDTVTRMIAEPMSEDLGVQLVVQNIDGAGGTVGAGQAATSDPDGYTVLMHHIGMSTAPALYEDLAYDPIADFKPVGLVTEVPMTIIASSDFEPETFEEFVTYVQENADTVTMAHAGEGSASNLCGLLLTDALGVEVTAVPYDGTGPAMAELVGGQVDFMCDQTTNTTGQITAGEVKAYAATTPERIEALPDLPTTTEGGQPDIQVSVWHGLYVPVETPDEVVSQLTDSLQVALADEKVIDQMADLGTAPVSEEQATPEAHATLLEEQTATWADIIGSGQGG
ncbi:Tripartite-type tricarboxylate transporter, receptor component TctC [Promicromonospora umidemergens]|uniref:Tripartite tricarboxylate transporter substrate-binding protein n=1 Tax=Promicromonospora umidemergens TaxID=629679 RepID=A0ABP8X3B2_9MICO|nr:tripartite tricarboxylate transporter substrate-binding protein [Promicromonospora umidemergens]MCP2281131.1 Tripartite-type tricarboxylate transporter, receptor component TctC [Promicromonospora umidemergens]